MPKPGRSLDRAGAPDKVAVGCHGPPGPDTVTPDQVNRLLAAVRALTAIAPKAIVEREKAAGVVEEVEWLDRVTPRP